MRVASMEPRSEANGPGARAVIWLQGCDRACPGCCNPEMQSFDGGNDMDAFVVAAWVHQAIVDHNVRGLTLSGGEPLHPNHRDELAKFFGLLQESIRKNRQIADFENEVQYFDVMVFTGYPEEDIENMKREDPRLSYILQHIDMLIAGPYDENNKNDYGLISSTNQSIVRLSDAFKDVTDEILREGPRINEVIIRDDKVIITGISSFPDALKMVGISDIPSPK